MHEAEIRKLEDIIQTLPSSDRNSSQRAAPLLWIWKAEESWCNSQIAASHRRLFIPPQTVVAVSRMSFHFVSFPAASDQFAENQKLCVHIWTPAIYYTSFKVTCSLCKTTRRLNKKA